MRRRTFLTSGLASVLAGPFVNIVREGVADAQPAGARAFITFYHPHSVKRYFFPNKPAADGSFTLTEALSPLETLRDNCVFFGPVTTRSGLPPRAYDNHAGIMHVLTQWADLDNGPLGPSIDQVIADRVGASTPRKSLNLWTWVDPESFGQPTLSQRGPKQPVSNEASPFAAFKSLMTGKGAMPDADYERIRKRRKSVLDNITGELGGLQMRLAGEERRMMDAHLEAVRGVEKALFGDSTGGGSGAACKDPVLGGEFDIRTPANYEKLVKLHIDVMVTAIACGVTKVGILQMGNDHNEEVTFPFIGIDKTHHLGIQHNGTTPEWTTVTKWFLSQFAYLMTSLKALTTPTGNLLSDSVLLYCNNMGSGHSTQDMSIVVGGNAGGRIKGNRLIQTEVDSTDPMKAQMATSQVLLSIAHAMGLTDLEHFGRPGAEFCPGPVPGLVT